jgi:flagellar biogenesis protein FliO
MAHHVTLLIFILVLQMCSAEHISAEELNISDQSHFTEESTLHTEAALVDEPVGSRTVDKQVILSRLKLCTLFLAVVGTVAYFVKKQGIPVRSRKSEISNIQLTEEKYLGQNLSLVLVKVQNQNLLLSKQQGRIEFLTALAPDATSPAHPEISIASSARTQHESPDATSYRKRKHVLV